MTETPWTQALQKEADIVDHVLSLPEWGAHWQPILEHASKSSYVNLSEPNDEQYAKAAEWLTAAGAVNLGEYLWRRKELLRMARALDSYYQFQEDTHALWSRYALAWAPPGLGLGSVTGTGYVGCDDPILLTQVGVMGLMTAARMTRSDWLRYGPLIVSDPIFIAHEGGISIIGDTDHIEDDRLVQTESEWLLMKDGASRGVVKWALETARQMFGTLPRRNRAAIRKYTYRRLGDYLRPNSSQQLK